MSTTESLHDKYGIGTLFTGSVKMRITMPATGGRNKKLLSAFAIFYIFLSFLMPKNCLATALADSGIYVIPYPQKVVIGGDNFNFKNSITIVLDKNHSVADEFTANELIRDLKNEWNTDAVIANKAGGFSIILRRQKNSSIPGKQSYELSVDREQVIISAPGEDGLFYGTQTLLQLIQKNGEGHKVIGMKITDWPDIAERAVHYDTKHHQDKIEYVRNFIKELARYKINILVWEWEDKFAYPSHPEIAAPGAFTPKEIQGLTDYARMYHIQLAPLVQGLGHVSFILKWPQFAAFREIPASNFEFCPLKEGSYNLLFDLWKDAMDATKGSEYIHIGSDETYELGMCDACKAKANEIGKKGLYHLFSDKAAKYILSKGRKPMIWETAMGWQKEGADEKEKIMPNKGLVLTEDMGEIGVDKVKKAKSLGYKVFFYDPNPGIEPLFLPYTYRENDDRKKEPGCLERSYNALTAAANSGVFDGMIRTSWDDAGLHNQVWMLCFLTSAEFSWNGHAPGLNEFKETFFRNYYGPDAVKMDELFNLLNESAYYYWDTFERKVWHFGDVGKTHLPDLPRGDALEYDPYWNKQYKEMIDRSVLELQKMDSALAIIKTNKTLNTTHPYDFEIFESIADLVHHTCQTYIDLSNLEYAIRKAHQFTFVNRDSAYNSMEDATKIVEHNLTERAQVYNELVTTWEKTRLPKGMSTPDKKYFFQQDRTRHLANRRPDMSYLINDEQDLDLEGYLEKLKAYMEKYKNNSF
ncbi:MAG: beta-N-acetylhexosaminidase [Ginsengibacter sp.]